MHHALPGGAGRGSLPRLRMGRLHFLCENLMFDAEFQGRLDFEATDKADIIPALLHQKKENRLTQLVLGRPERHSKLRGA